MLGNPYHLSPRRVRGETETNLPLFHRQDKGNPTGISEPGVTQQALACWARRPTQGCLHWPLASDTDQPDARPVLLLSSRGAAPGSQTFAPWKAVFLHPLSHLICDVSRVGKTPSFGRWGHGGWERGRDMLQITGRTASSHLNLEKP